MPARLLPQAPTLASLLLNCQGSWTQAAGAWPSPRCDLQRCACCLADQLHLRTPAQTGRPRLQSVLQLSQRARNLAARTCPAPLSQVNKNAQAVSFSDLYGLWIILGAGLALGTCTMLTQRGLRRWRKRRGMPRRSGLAPAGAGPLPVEHQPLRFMRSVLSLGRRARPLHVGNGQKQCGNGSMICRPVARSTQEAAAAVDARTSSGKAWDLESNQSSGMAPELPASAASAVAPGSPAGSLQVSTGLQVAAVPGAPASQTGGSGARHQQHEQRMSALQAAETIYGAVKWKSQLKTSGGSPSWRSGSG